MISKGSVILRTRTKSQLRVENHLRALWPRSPARPRRFRHTYHPRRCQKDWQYLQTCHGDRTEMRERSLQTPPFRSDFSLVVPDFSCSCTRMVALAVSAERTCSRGPSGRDHCSENLL